MGRRDGEDAVPGPDEAEGSDEKGRPKHVQLGPDDIAESSLVGEWGWNSTLRLALGEE